MKSKFLENVNDFYERKLLEPLQIGLALTLIPFAVIQAANSIPSLGYQDLEDSRNKKKATIEKNFKAADSSMLKSAYRAAGMAGYNP